ncbi:hypothetical protein [Roseivivax sp. THAF30]|uniref:hypothetical protein n=1 Tax=Roseivivax sp. THAF30 TaxID=2587852 RepID=UPI0012685C7A|nr:hypothetical protein [Roseivivax sp. THAF30]QFT62721.1 hypothetical protein FIU91_07255 [Roseivivax sp. THAF30]
MKHLNLNPLKVLNAKGSFPAAKYIQFPINLDQTPQRELFLRYEVEKAPKGQRFQNHLLLYPTLHLRGFTFRVDVERVELKGAYITSPNWSELQKRLSRFTRGSCYAVDEGSGSFRVVFIRPSKFHIRGVLDAFNKSSCLNLPGEIAKIEISLDTFSRFLQPVSSRWYMLDLMWRHFLPPSEAWGFANGFPRSVSGPSPGDVSPIRCADTDLEVGNGSWIGRHNSMVEQAYGVSYPAGFSCLEDLEPSNYNQPRVDGVTLFGDPEGELSFRIMRRDIPDKTGAYDSCREWGEDTCRPSIVVSLSGDELRRNHLTSAHAIGGGLRHVGKKYLKFWLPALKVTSGWLIAPTELERFRNGGCFAVRQATLAARERDAFLNSRVPGRRKRTGWKRSANDDFEGLAPFSKFNNRVADAVRKAEKRWAYLD